MTNSIEPEVVIELDRPRRMRLDLNAIDLIEQKCGVNLLSEDVEIQNLSVKTLKTFLWCMFVHEDPELTEEQVGSMVSVINMQRIFVSLGDLQNRAVGKVDESGKGPQPEAKQRLSSAG